MDDCSLKYYSDVTSRKIDWLWYPYIPFGKITVIQGDPGEGKTTFVLSLLSIISNGEKLPFSDNCVSGKVMGKLIDGAKSAYEINNEESYHDYYSDVEISYAASKAHPKAAIQFRNREMVDRADLVLCCIERKSGGAYQTVLYAKKQNKQIINLAGGMTTFCE